jgi:hypothetical protein
VKRVLEDLVEAGSQQEGVEPLAVVNLSGQEIGQGVGVVEQVGEPEGGAPPIPMIDTVF